MRSAKEAKVEHLLQLFFLLWG